MAQGVQILPWLCVGVLQSALNACAEPVARPLATLPTHAHTHTHYTESNGSDFVLSMRR